MGMEEEEGEKRRCDMRAEEEGKGREKKVGCRMREARVEKGWKGKRRKRKKREKENESKVK